MDFLYIKSLHIIFVVTWFSGLFYIVRLFIYHTEADKKEEPARSVLQNQYKIMEKRLWYIITWPSAILTSIFAFWLLFKNPFYLKMPWMHVKLIFVLALYGYHLYCHKIYKQLQNNKINYTATRLRLFNEAPTIILFAVVFLVVLKSSINWVWGVIGIVFFGVLLTIGVRLYKNIRKKNSWDKQEQDSKLGNNTN